MALHHSGTLELLQEVANTEDEARQHVAARVIAILTLTLSSLTLNPRRGSMWRRA